MMDIQLHEFLQQLITHQPPINHQPRLCNSPHTASNLIITEQVHSYTMGKIELVTPILKDCI